LVLRPIGVSECGANAAGRVLGADHHARRRREAAAESARLEGGRGTAGVGPTRQRYMTFDLGLVL
jgi:hypothetical protein